MSRFKAKAKKSKKVNKICRKSSNKIEKERIIIKDIEERKDDIMMNEGPI